MPTYDYKCENGKCGQVSEVFHGMADKPEVLCSACGRKMKRLIGGGAGVIFKGTGYYCTDFRNKSAAPAPAAK